MDVMAKQASVFMKEHMDRILAEDRDVDCTGKLGRCSFAQLLEESGALDDKGSHYGPLAQAAASYYVRQRMDDINRRAFELKTANGSAGFYPGSAMGRLANEMANVNDKLAERCENYTSIVDKGTEELMWGTGHLDHYEESFMGKGVYFPAATRQFAGMSSGGYPTMTMDSVMEGVKSKGMSYELYGHGEKLYMQDRFCELLSDIEKPGQNDVGKWHAKSVMFDEVYRASNVAHSMSSGKQSFVPEGENCVKALLGNCAAERLDKLGYFDYEKTRNKELATEIQSRREIKNKPDFMKEGSSPEVKPLGFDGYDF